METLEHLGAVIKALQGRIYSLERFRLSQTMRPSMPREVIKPYEMSAEEAVATLGAIAGGPGVDVTDNVVSVDLATDPGLEFDAAGDAGKLRLILADAQYNAMVANAADLIFRAGWIRAH